MKVSIEYLDKAIKFSLYLLYWILITYIIQHHI